MISTSSLAVFYVEQVALNRHVLPHNGYHVYARSRGGCQEQCLRLPWATTICYSRASNKKAITVTSETRPDGQLTSRRIQ